MFFKKIEFILTESASYVNYYTISRRSSIDDSELKQLNQEALGVITLPKSKENTGLSLLNKKLNLSKINESRTSNRFVFKYFFFEDI
jgi:hypothetical protein